MLDSILLIGWVPAFGLVALGFGQIAWWLVREPKCDRPAERVIAQLAVGFLVIATITILAWVIAPGGRPVLWGTGLVGAILGLGSLLELSGFFIRFYAAKAFSKDPALSGAGICEKSVGRYHRRTVGKDKPTPTFPRMTFHRLILRLLGGRGWPVRGKEWPGAISRQGRGNPPEWVILGARFLALAFALAGLFCALAPITDFRAGQSFVAKLRAWQIGESLWITFGRGEAGGPSLADALFLWMNAVAGPSGPNLAQWWLGILLAWTAGELVGFWAGRRAGYVARAVVLAFPAVNYQMFTPLPELATAFWCTVAAWGLEKALAGQDSRWALLSAVFGIAACLTHPLGAIWLAVALSAVIIRWIDKSKGMASLRHFCRLPAWGLVIGSLGAIVWFWTVPAGDWVMAKWERANSLEQGSLVRDHSWPLSLQLSDVFSAQTSRTPPCCRLEPNRPASHFVDELGLLFPVMLPAILWYGVIPRKRLLLVAGAIALAFLVAVGWGASWIVPAVPLFTLGIMRVWQTRTEKYPLVDTAVHALGLLLLGGQLVWPAGEVAERYRVILGLESRSEYLARREPVGVVAEILSVWPAGGVKVLSTVPEAALLPGQIVDEENFRRQTRYNELAKTADEFVLLLRSWGITHVLLAEPLAVAGSDQSSLGLFLPPAGSPAGETPLVPLADFVRKRACGHMWRYRLFYLASQNVTTGEGNGAFAVPELSPLGEKSTPDASAEKP